MHAVGTVRKTTKVISIAVEEHWRRNREPTSYVVLLGVSTPCTDEKMALTRGNRVAVHEIYVCWVGASM